MFVRINKEDILDIVELLLIIKDHNHDAILRSDMGHFEWVERQITCNREGCGRVFKPKKENLDGALCPECGVIGSHKQDFVKVGAKR